MAEYVLPWLNPLLILLALCGAGEATASLRIEFFHSLLSRHGLGAWKAEYSLYSKNNMAIQLFWLVRCTFPFASISTGQDSIT